MLNVNFIDLIGATLFFVAIVHTFSTKYFEHLAYTNPRYSGILHLLGEIEIVFGFWAMVLVLFMFGTEMNTMSFLGYPLAYYMTAQGSLLAFVIMLFWCTGKQEDIDEEFGYAEREDD